jgi:hypothetical protein
MIISTNVGLEIWDGLSDQFNHTLLAQNLQDIDSMFVGFDVSHSGGGSVTGTKLPKRLRTSATVPGSGVQGDLVFLTAAVANTYPANIILRYDGSAWRPIMGLEIHSALPTSGNFAGRVIVLSAAAGSFDAWSIVRYDGSAWGLVGGWSAINTGAGSLNIQGLVQTGDVFINNVNRGFILKDRVTGTNYRLFFTNGNLSFEAVI